MVSIGIIALALLLLALLVALGWLVLRYHFQVEAADLERIYLYVVSFLGLTLGAFCLLSAVIAFTRLVLTADPSAGLVTDGLQTERLGVSWDRSQRDIIARQLGPVFVAVPIWLLAYRGAMRRSLAKQAWTVHRLYLYVVAGLFLVTAVGFVASIGAQGLRILLGLVDLSSQAAIRDLWQVVAQGLLNGGICAAIWWTHYRAIPQPAVGDQSVAA